MDFSTGYVNYFGILDILLKQRVIFRNITALLLSVAIVKAIVFNYDVLSINYEHQSEHVYIRKFLENMSA